MFKLNNNYFKLEENYIFSEVAKRVKEYKKENPQMQVVDLGIGDIKRPLPRIVTEEMAKASLELAKIESFRGYGPEQGYSFLREKIAKEEYSTLNISSDEIYISDGTKCDIANILDLFDKKITVGIPETTYPVYLETNIIEGNEIVQIDAGESNLFLPKVPNVPIDIMYLCMPNNPTGTVLRFGDLKKWVNYAKENNVILLYDGAYEKYIQDSDVPHSIYEIDGAKEVAIEFRSFSKSAGFTGVRCSYIVIPNELCGTVNGEKICLNKLWKRRSGTKFNGVSYITQVGAYACFLPEAKIELEKNIQSYVQNAKVLKECLQNLKYVVYGGDNSPYIWLRKEKCVSSWNLWEEFLQKYGIVSTPGIGFGKSGDSFIRLSAFCSSEEIQTVIARLKS